ncbi:DUF357 domain-containing protein [Candidatus Woesearchaeota archaeon]|nr:DUF357 domain-containing protein [Candidatus Woesearchaeota archaeon]
MHQKPSSQEVTEERLEKYFSVTERALKKIKIKNPDKTSLNLQSVAEDFLQMAKTYFSDAKHFQEKGDWVTAFAAVAYAHAWLDAGARMGLFYTGGDTELFAWE